MTLDDHDDFAPHLEALWTYLHEQHHVSYARLAALCGDLWHLRVSQGALTTVIALGYAFIPDVSSAYWIFSVITTQVYLIVYLLMFVAAVRLRQNQPDHPRGYKAPALVALCVVGFLASLAALLIGFVPPSQFGGSSPVVYLVIVGGGALGLGLLVPFLFYRFRKPSWKQPQGAEVTAS